MNDWYWHQRNNVKGASDRDLHCSITECVSLAYVKNQYIKISMNVCVCAIYLFYTNLLLLVQILASKQIL